MHTHDLRSSSFGPRRRLGAQLLRITLFTASLATLAGFVAADVLAAEPEVAAFDDAADFDAEDELEGRTVFAAVMHIPDGAAPAASSPPEPPKKIRKKKRSKKFAFGRFEGY